MSRTRIGQEEDLNKVVKYLRGRGCKINEVTKGNKIILWICVGHVGGLDIEKYTFRCDGSAMPKTFGVFRKVLS